MICETLAQPSVYQALVVQKRVEQISSRYVVITETIITDSGETVIIGDSDDDDDD